MATNRAHERSSPLDVAPTNAPNDPVVSGDPILFGQYPGVALTDERDDGTVTAQFDGVWDLDVVGANNAGNTAITAGDRLFYDTVSDEINVDATDGVEFGIAREDVASGATTNIEVIVVPD